MRETRLEISWNGSLAKAIFRCVKTSDVYWPFKTVREGPLCRVAKLHGRANSDVKNTTLFTQSGKGRLPVEVQCRGRSSNYAIM